MKKDVCSTQVREKYRLDENQYQSLINDIKEVLGDENLQGKDVNHVVNSVLRRRMIDIKMMENERLRTFEKFDTNRTYLNQKSFNGDALAALHTLLEPKSKYKYEGMGSVWTNKRVITDKVQALLDGEINKVKGGMDRMISGEMDKDLMVHIMDGLENVSADVKSIALGIRRFNKLLLDLKRSVGFNTGEITNYIVKQSHNASSMFKMGFESWKALVTDVNNGFDFKKMGFYTQDAINDYLEKFYHGRVDELAQMRGSKITNDFKSIVTNRPAKIMAEGRTVHFKNGEGAYNYFKAMNPNATIYSTLIRGLDADSAKIACAEIFGPNFKAGFKALLAEAKRSSFNKGEKSLTKFNMNAKFAERMFKSLAEGEFQDEMNALAITFDTGRKITNMSKLGNAIVTTLTDFAYAGAAISANTGRSFSQELFRMVTGTIENFASPSTRKELAVKMGSFANDVNGGTMHTRYGDYGRARNAFDKFHNGYMRATGLSNQAVSIKLAEAKRLLVSLYEDSHLKFNEMAQAEGLKKFGITEKEWDIIKNAHDELPNGWLEGLWKGKTERAITAEAIMNLPDEAFGGLKGDALRDYKLQITSGLQQFIMNVAERGSPTAGLKYHAIKNSFDRNTFTGQVVQSMLQFKSFGFAMYDTLDMIMHTNSNSKYGNIPRLSQTILTSSLFGAIAIYCRDIIQGNEPRKLETTEDQIAFMRDSLIQSGAGGILFDVFAADYDKSFINLPSIVAGPMISGVFKDTVSLAGAAVLHTNWSDKDEQTKRIRQTLIALEKNSPSLLFTKQLINKNIFDGVHILLNTKRRPQKKNMWSFYN